MEREGVSKMTVSPTATFGVQAAADVGRAEPLRVVGRQVGPQGKANYVLVPKTSGFLL